MVAHINSAGAVNKNWMAIFWAHVDITCCVRRLAAGGCCYRRAASGISAHRTNFSLQSAHWLWLVRTLTVPEHVSVAEFASWKAYEATSCPAIADCNLGQMCWGWSCDRNNPSHIRVKQWRLKVVDIACVGAVVHLIHLIQARGWPP